MPLFSCEHPRVRSNQPLRIETARRPQTKRGTTTECGTPATPRYGRPAGPDQVLRVFLVLLADVLHDFVARHQAVRRVQRERPRVGARIVDRHILLQRPEIGARVALDGVQLLGMRMPDEIEPELVVEPDRVDRPACLHPSGRSNRRTRSGSDPRMLRGRP